MLDQIERFKTEIFALLSVAFGFIVGRRKNNADAASSEAEADKKRAEEDSIRIHTMLELQTGMLEIQDKLQEMYDSREAQRNANTIEQQRLAQSQSDLVARNAVLSDQLHQVTQANFERELAYTSRIAELERKLDQQLVRVESIEKKTGSLENKMPSHDL